MDTWNGEIVEIAICELDLENYSYELIFESLIGYERVREGAWIFDNSDLTPEMIKQVYPKRNVFSIANKVRRLVKGSIVTSYHTKFDFAFLTRSPWRLTEVASRGDCIMQAAKPVCDIPHYYYGIKQPKLTEAYRIIVDQPLPGNTHRAGVDCALASQVLLKLIENGDYKIETGGN